MFGARQQTFRSDTPLDAVTIIGSRAVIRGATLHVQQDLRVDGRIEADITAEGRLVIGPNGSVRGTVSAREMVIEGQVVGSIQVEKMLTLQSTAVVHGSLTAARLSIEEGASGMFEIVTRTPSPRVTARRPSVRADCPPPYSGDGAVEASAQEVDSLSVESSRPPSQAEVIPSESASASSDEACLSGAASSERPASSAEAVKPSVPSSAGRGKVAHAGGGEKADGEELPDAESASNVESSVQTDRFW